MEETVVILQQIGIIFILIAVGAVLFRTGLVNEKGSKQLSNIIVNVVSPAVIFMSYQTEYDPERVHGLLWTFVLSFAVYAVSIALSFILVRGKEGRETAIERFCIVYSNCGFMGIPLIAGMFGYEGVFYAGAVVTVFNIMVWTHGVMTMCGRLSLSGMISALKSPNIIAIAAGLVCYFFKIHIPYIPSEAVNHFAAMNTPLAMLIAGITIASTDLREVIKNAHMAVIVFFKLIVIPVICTAVIRLFGAPAMVYTVVAVTTACPTAGMSTILALKFDKNAGYCSELFAVSTLASAVSLPLLVLFAQTIL